MPCSLIDAVFADCYCPDTGAPAKAIRLLVGLHYLKHAFNVSDEGLIERWVENPYWQHFCGFHTLQHEVPLHPTSLTKWRQRVGEEKLVELLAETVATAQREGHATPQDLAQVNVDTAVQEKNITHSTDEHNFYSLHEPDVKCISKGKAHKRYESGQKASVTTSNRSNWIVGVDLCKENPYDGHTLAQAIATVEQTTGVKVTDAYVDKGYRGHDYQGEATIHISGTSTRRLTRAEKKRRKRRSAVEPKIGHLKSDHRLGRCFLKGLAGDAINLVLAAAGCNLRKLLGAIASALFCCLWSDLTTDRQRRTCRSSHILTA